MPAMTNLLVKDDNNADVTYFPVRDSPFPEWRSNVAGVPLFGQARIKTQWETMKSGMLRVNAKLECPTMEVIPSGTVDASGHTAAAKVAFTTVFSITGLIHPRSTAENRADAFRQFVHLLMGASATTGGGVNPSSAAADGYLSAGVGNMAPYTFVNLLFPGS